MAPCWKIDELAQRTGLTVDTIRYYAREGLLTPPERSGRHKLYGRDHMTRLERIRDLQAKRFSLASIRAILDADRPGLEGIFQTEGRAYGLDDLIERAALPRAVVDSLRAVALLPDPATLGREHYDDSDLDMLRAVEELLHIGMTREIIVQVGAIYVRKFAELQKEVHDVFAGTTLDWDPDALRALQERLTENSARLVPAVNRVLNYVHQRTVQRLTFDAVRMANDTGTGVGGVRIQNP
ncbi:MAG: MerR family transcriptional regulator [Actinomycetota bacterium]